MATPDLATMMDKEREKLTTSRTEALARREQIDAEITTIDEELRRIDAYLNFKGGKSAPATRTPSGGQRRTGVRKSVLDLIKNNPSGLKKADILSRLEVGDDQSFAGSISNALAGLKKAKLIDLDKNLYTPL